jgi:hypothetical protein
MKIKSILFIAIIGMIIADVFPKEVTTVDLRDLFTKRIEAFSKNDTAGLRTLCTKDYIFINATGSKMNFEDVTKKVAASKNQIKSYVILTYQPYVAQDESMAFAVSEIEEEVLQDKTIVKSSLLITEIYRKENKKWKIQLTQISQKICDYPGR